MPFYVIQDLAKHLLYLTLEQSTELRWGRITSYILKYITSQNPGVTHTLQMNVWHFLGKNAILLILWSFKFIAEKKILKSHQSTWVWSRYWNPGSSSFSLLPRCPEVRHYFMLFFALMRSCFMLFHHCGKENGQINHEWNFKTSVSLKISVLFGHSFTSFFSRQCKIYHWWWGMWLGGRKKNGSRSFLLRSWLSLIFCHSDRKLMKKWWE